MRLLCACMQVKNAESIPYACVNISRDRSKLVSYENFNYSNDLLGCILRENLQATNFTGISVSMHMSS